MAKIIYACSRKSAFDRTTEAKLRRTCERLEPDNLSRPVAHKVAVDPHMAFAVINSGSVLVQGDNVLLGGLYEPHASWHKPRSGQPDGSYAIFRSSDECLEVLSDAAATRTVWYVFDDEQFIASTSQRAIVMFLGNFRFNEAVVPWMLSTGSLGPDASWDMRIRRLPPDASLTLDKATWSMRVERKPIEFAEQPRPRTRHRELLLSDIRAVMSSLKGLAQIGFDDYRLPLSGGYDSRAILCFLAEGGVPQNLKAITWGLERSINRKGNDAALARELAGAVGVAHRYFHTDVRAESIDKVIDRFIHCGEGRIDHLSGYSDGLETWRRLVEDEGCRGIIRGDEGFGWIPVSSESSVRLSVGTALCSDFRNLRGISAKFGLPKQELPRELCRRKGETLEAWRDRLYHAFRMPTVLAALSDIKYSYVEVINPLLARAILRRVRELPDGLRTDKALFRDIVRSVGPQVPFASEGAIANINSLLKKKEVVELMRKKLASDSANRVFIGDFLAYVLGGTRVESAPRKGKGKSSWRAIRSLVPRFVKNWIRDLALKPSVDGNVLAFRVFLIVRMNEVLSADCAAIASADRAGSDQRPAEAHPAQRYALSR